MMHTKLQFKKIEVSFSWVNYEFVWIDLSFRTNFNPHISNSYNKSIISLLP